jgi:hypothetical protein
LLICWHDAVRRRDQRFDVSLRATAIGGHRKAWCSGQLERPTSEDGAVFTLIGIGIIVVVAFLSNREQSKDSGSPDDYIRYTRQDTRTVVWLLAAVVFMLSLIADRIH